ncbi:MAG: hypothetical protein ABJO36_01440 [Litorimonas sp.]
MTFMDVQTQNRKVLPAIVAGVALLIAASSSIAGLNMFGARIGFGFIPLLVLAIWPRRANTLISLPLVFLAGLFTDWATGGITGQWALLFVLVWGFLRPELRSSPFAPISLCLVWLATCGLAIVVLSASGYFVFGLWPDFAALGRQMIFATVLLPLFLLLRHGLALRFSDSEDWG